MAAAARAQARVRKRSFLGCCGARPGDPIIEPSKEEAELLDAVARAEAAAAALSLAQKAEKATERAVRQAEKRGSGSVKVPAAGNAAAEGSPAERRVGGQSGSLRFEPRSGRILKRGSREHIALALLNADPVWDPLVPDGLGLVSINGESWTAMPNLLHPLHAPEGCRMLDPALLVFVLGPRPCPDDAPPKIRKKAERQAAQSTLAGLGMALAGGWVPPLKPPRARHLVADALAATTREISAAEKAATTAVADLAANLSALAKEVGVKAEARAEKAAATLLANFDTELLSLRRDLLHDYGINGAYAVKRDRKRLLDQKRKNLQELVDRRQVLQRAKSNKSHLEGLRAQEAQLAAELAALGPSGAGLVKVGAARDTGAMAAIVARFAGKPGGPVHAAMTRFVGDLAELLRTQTEYRLPSAKVLFAYDAAAVLQKPPTPMPVTSYIMGVESLETAPGPSRAQMVAAASRRLAWAVAALKYDCLSGLGRMVAGRVRAPAGRPDSGCAAGLAALDKLLAAQDPCPRRVVVAIDGVDTKSRRSSNMIVGHRPSSRQIVAAAIAGSLALVPGTVTANLAGAGRGGKPSATEIKADREAVSCNTAIDKAAAAKKQVGQRVLRASAVGGHWATRLYCVGLWERLEDAPAKRRHSDLPHEWGPLCGEPAVVVIDAIQVVGQTWSEAMVAAAVSRVELPRRAGENLKLAGHSPPSVMLWSQQPLAVAEKAIIQYAPRTDSLSAKAGKSKGSGVQSVPAAGAAIEVFPLDPPVRWPGFVQLQWEP